jgi:hypothetical protein
MTKHLACGDYFKQFCRNPTLAKCGGEAQHLEKLGIWSPLGLPNVQSSTARGKTPRIRVFLVSLEKVLKHRYRKCPRIGNSDICSPSYGQKKGRESNWQFDSRPLKVGNRCLPNIRSKRATWRWKDLDEGYNFGLDLVAIQVCSRELWRFKVPRVPSGQFRDSIGTPFRESQEFVPLGCRCGGASQSILYGGWWWHPPSPGRGESCGLKCPWLVPTPKGVPKCELTTRVVCFFVQILAWSTKTSS